MRSQLRAGLDHEDAALTDGGYTVIVTGYDPLNADTNPTASVAITATDVNEKPGVALETGETEALEQPENHEVVTDPDADPATTAVVLGTYVPTDVDDTDTVDSDDDTAVKLSLGGDDADSFKLGDADPGTGARELTFKDSPNYESPTDAGMDNTYNVSIVATDDEGLTGMKALIIKVTNEQEDGSVSILPVQPAIGQEVTAKLTDEDGDHTEVKWQWSSSGTETGGYTNIEGATTSSYTPRAKSDDVDATPDVDEGYAGDEGKFLRATVTYKDGATLDEDDPNTDGDDSAAAEVMEETELAVRAVPDVNTAPYFEDDPVELTVKEIAGEGDSVDTVMATDDESDVLTYTLSGGADMASFKVSAGGEVTVNTDLDYDAGQRMYTIEVTAADPFGMSGTGTVTIEVEGVNEAPKLSGGDLAEDGYPEGTTEVTTFMAADEEGDEIKWTVMDGDSGKFSIEGGVLMFSSPPNFEAPGDALYEGDPDDADDNNLAENNQYVVTVKATEMHPEGSDELALSDMKTITVIVTDEEEAGTITLDRVLPQTGADLEASLTDPDGGEDADSQDPPTAITWLWSIPKVNRPVLETDAHWQPAAGTASTGTNVTDSYEPVAGDANEYLRVKASYTDQEGDGKVAYKMSYHPVRMAPDTTTDANNPPTFDDTSLERSIDEDAAMGAEVGDPVTASDSDDGDIRTYVLGGADEASFAIDKMTGQITVDGELDHERTTDGNEVYTVTVTAYDPFNTASGTPATVTITVGDVQEDPTVTTDAATDELSMVDENHVVEADPDAEPPVSEDDVIVLGSYGADDDDADDRLENGSAIDPEKVKLSLGGDDADAFKLAEADNDGNQDLTFASSPNYESPTDAGNDSTYEVTVIATDSDGNTGEKKLTITVENMQEDGSVSITPDQPAIGQPVMATLSDEDGGETEVKWQWWSAQTEAGSFEEIDGATSMSYTPRPEIDDVDETEADESYAGDEGMFLQARVTYKDAATLEEDDDPNDGVDPTAAVTVMKETTHAVRAVPETNTAPYFEDDPVELKVKESVKKGESAGSVSAKDDENDALTYSLSGGADMASFKVESDGEVKVNTDLDYDAGQQMYTIEVAATDPFGMSGTGTVTIEVEDVNEAPTLGPKPPAPAVNVAPAFADDATTTFMVYENAAADTAVGMVEAIDEGDVLAYSDDSDYFAVDDDGNITTTMALDYETMASHTVTVTATDDDADDPLSASITVTVNVSNVEECEDAGATAVDTSNAGAMADCEALLASKATLMGDDATRMLDWSADTPMADWYGVRKLTASGRVEWLYLHGVSSKDATDDAPARAEVKLNGTIPAELGGLTEMTRLYLHRNNLTGGIPAELNSLTSLVWLRLYDNDLSGDVPDLSEMASLERFYVHQNDLTGGVPTALSNSVTHILVHRNDLTGEIPDLSGMTNLVWLGLYDNMLSGEIPASVGSIANLERLYLHGNMLMGEVPMEIGNIASLTNLWLENNMLSGELPSSLNDLTNLERVQISGGKNAFTGCIPAALANAATTDTADTGLPTCGEAGQ